MIVAVACDGLDVAPYFTQSTSYMCYAIERGKVVNSANVPIIDNSAEKALEVLDSIGADTLITGRIEYDFAAGLCRKNIEVVAGAAGAAVDVMHDYLTRTLSGITEPCSIGGEGAAGYTDLAEEKQAAQTQG